MIPLDANLGTDIQNSALRLVESVTIRGLGNKSLTISFDAPVIFEVLHHPAQDGVARHELRWFYGRPTTDLRQEDRALTEGTASWSIKLE